MNRISAFLALAFVSISIPARAGYIVDVQEVGGNVVATGSGSLNLTSLTPMTSSQPINALVDADMGVIRIGSSAWDSYTGITGPLSFGPGGLFFASDLTPTGPFAGLLRNDDAQGVVQGIFVPGAPQHYVSGTLLDPSSATWKNASFASLGLTEGTYVWNWGSGDTADTFTVEIASVPEPPSWAIMFPGIGLIAGAMWRWQRQERAAERRASCVEKSPAERRERQG